MFEVFHINVVTRRVLGMLSSIVGSKNSVDFVLVDSYNIIDEVLNLRFIPDMLALILDILKIESGLLLNL